VQLSTENSQDVGDLQYPDTELRATDIAAVSEIIDRRHVARFTAVER